MSECPLGTQRVEDHNIPEACLPCFDGSVVPFGRVMPVACHDELNDLRVNYPNWPIGEMPEYRQRSIERVQTGSAERIISDYIYKNPEHLPSTEFDSMRLFWGRMATVVCLQEGVDGGRTLDHVKVLIQSAARHIC